MSRSELDWHLNNPKNMTQVNYFTTGQIHDAGHIDGFGDPENFIKAINLPLKMKIGEEYIPTKGPLIIIQRSKSKFKEFFSWPLFSVTKKIKIQFHWEGISVVGSNMIEPNKFILSIPSKNNTNNWYLKVICKNDAKPGFKPLYISIDTLHENILLKYFLKFFKIAAVVALLCLIIIGIFYRDNIIGEKLFFGDLLSDKSMTGQTLSPFLILLVLIVAFWKNISNTFESIYKREKAELEENLTYNGVKEFAEHYGIEIINNT